MSSSDSDGGDSAASLLSFGDEEEGIGGQSSRNNLQLNGSDGIQRGSRGHPSNDETKKQIMLRDRLRISRPMFMKADFLGDDFSLLSAVDEAGKPSFYRF